jgi:ferric iron reductase protein FhuF
MFPINNQVLQKNYNILFSGDLPGLYFPAVDIYDEARFGCFINEYAKAIASPKLSVTGSLFVKRYSTLMVGAMYGFIHYDYGIDLSVHNVCLVLKDQNVYYRLMKTDEPEGLALVRDRSDKREQYVGHVLTENITPVFEHIIRHTGIDAATLWATLSYSLAYWKGVWVRNAKFPVLQEQIEEDYRYLVREARPEWFGATSRNPLIDNFHGIDDPIHAGQPILLRHKCCLNYCLPGDDRYCYTCPRITDERRIEKYIAAHANEVLLKK